MRDVLSIGRYGHLPERTLLALFALVGVIGVLKGLGSDILNGVDFYWMINYEHGFIKRALIGALFRPLLTRAAFEHLKPVILAAHVAACVAIIYVCHALFWRAVRREESFDAALTLTVTFLCLMSSPLMPSLAYVVGYLDVYIVTLLLVGFWLVLNEHYVAAALVASVAPVIHESFVFLWSSVAIMLVWSCAITKRHVPTKLLAAALPAVSAWAVVAFHSQAAAALAIQPLALPHEIKSQAIYQLGFTLPALFDHMTTIEYPGHLSNLAISAAYFLLPSAGILWAAGFINWRRWRPHASTTLLVAVAATVAPLTLLVITWDLSRFLAWSNLAAAIVLIGSGSSALLSRSSADRE